MLSRKSLMNSIIMAAGTASRFVPLSQEIPKGLLEVRGEILIERQIKQLIEAGITDITIVLGYKAEMFRYLGSKFGVRFVYNEDYNVYNNASSMIRVIDRLGDTFICCSDHYFVDNVFMDKATDSYYSALYSVGNTNEYCLTLDENEWIKAVQIGGQDTWYMAGHVFFNHQFSSRFKEIFVKEYDKVTTRQGYWEDVYRRHIQCLPIKVRKYDGWIINEFDSIDELRSFDASYICNTRSSVLKRVCEMLSCKEEELHSFKKMKHVGNHLLFSFMRGNETYTYDGRDVSVKRLFL